MRFGVWGLEFGGWGLSFEGFGSKPASIRSGGRGIFFGPLSVKQRESLGFGQGLGFRVQGLGFRLETLLCQMRREMEICRFPLVKRPPTYIKA